VLGGQASARDGLVPIGSGLRGPRGWRATVYATGLRHVSAYVLDRDGRLWVATSGATEHSQDAIYVVARAGARPRRVASGLHGPLGLAWYDHLLYLAEIGRVEAFGGLRGSRFSQRRTILRGPAARAENNNLVLAPNGRFLMAVSATCDHCTSTARRSAAIVSFRPDGADLRIYASGIRAAYGLAFVPGTSTLVATMNQRDDLGARTPGDWLAVVRQGENWRFPGCFGQGGSACRGVPKPVAELDPHAAAGGVAIVDGAAIVAEWTKGKVLRVALTRSGTAYRGDVSTFLTGLVNPLPVLALQAGGVLVGDWTTGTIYRVAHG